MQATLQDPPGGFDHSPGTVLGEWERDDILALCLEGEFDLANASEVVERIDQALLSDKHLIVDLSKATFIDSSVVNALFHAARTAEAKQRTVVLQLGTAPIVERVIEISQIEQALPRARSRADAIQTIEQRTN